MTSTDPIADMLTRIRNAFKVGKDEVVVPASQLKLSLAQILVEEGYLTKVEKVAEATIASRNAHTSRRAARRQRGEMLRLVLRYANGQPAVSSIERISKPSRRVYVSKDQLPVVRSGLGIAVLSTSRGLMTSRKAKKLGVGGEILCQLY